MWSHMNYVQGVTGLLTDVIGGKEIKLYQVIMCFSPEGVSRVCLSELS